MVRRWASLTLLLILAIGFATSKIALPVGDVLFVRVAEISCGSVYARKAVLLPKGEVVYFWERTRPPTDEEKKTSCCVV